VFKEEVTSGGYIAETDENGTLTTFGFGGGNPTEYSIEITEGHTYSWRLNEGTFNDIYESVSMTLADVSDVGVKSYGKKLCDDSFLQTLEGTNTTNDRNVYVGTFSFPVTITIKINESKKVGTPYMRVKTDDGYGSALYLYSNNKVRTVTIDGKTNPFGEYYFRYSSGLEKGAITSLQVEAGLTASAHEEYKEPVDGVVAIYPTTTLVADTQGVSITATYNKDTNKVIQELKNAILNLGGMI
jgi:hypothetical protein